MNPNPLDQLGVRRVINASGRMTRLGVNTLAPAVSDAMAVAGSSYVDIDDLHTAVGRELAVLIGAEAAMVTTGAAAGVALMVAACIAGEELTRVQSLPNSRGAPHEILIQAGHQVNFGSHITQLIRMAGGSPVPVGAVNNVQPDHLTESMGPDVAALLYVQSHHAVQKGMVSLDRCIAICNEHDVPVLVDAAAEEDLRRFATSGAALVTFSGGKAIGGPTSGIVAGRADLVTACRAQNQGIGRPMKVGKEAMVGLYVALSAYLRRDVPAERRHCSAIVDRLIAGFDGYAKTVRIEDEAGRGIERAGIVLTPDAAAELATFLRRGVPPIHPRGHLLNLGIVAFDPRPISDGDIEEIIDRVRAFFSR